VQQVGRAEPKSQPVDPHRTQPFRSVSRPRSHISTESMIGQHDDKKARRQEGSTTRRLDDKKEGQ